MLSGVKVIEMATYVAAPAASGILSDWGADVIKIEPISGCPMRKFYATAMTDEYPDNPVFDVDNRGKKAISLNTSTQAGRDIVKKLIEDADVFVTNVRPTQLEEQGLDYASLKLINPKLVFASVTGFGLEGPEKDKPGFDSVAFWAKSGLAWIMAPRNGSPVPLRIAVGDHVTGISTAAGILAAIINAQKTGEGSLVESSLVRNAAYAMATDFGTYARYGRIARSRDRSEPVVPGTNFYETRDGFWLFLNSRPGDSDWPNMLRAFELESLADDPRFADTRERRKNAVPLVTLIDEAFAKADFEEWKKRLDDEGIIWSPVQTFEQVMEDEQLEAAGVFVDQPKQDGSSYKGIASPIRFSGAPLEPRGPGPEIGQHSRDILSSIGMSDSEISDLIEAGTVRSA